MSARTKPHRGLRRGDPGFTLIEVLVAMVVFAVGCLGLAMCIPLGIGRVGKAGQQTRASQLASFKAEEILTKAYTDPDLNNGNHNDALNPYDGAYYLSWVVEDDQPVTNCKRVTLTVARDHVGAPRQAALVIVKPQL